jgi:hypothetical protein
MNYKLPEAGIPVYSNDEILGTLSGCDGEAKILCRRCAYTIVEDGRFEHVLSGFWLHLTFEHEGPTAPMGVSNLDQIGPGGVTLGFQIVVMPR